MTVRRPRQLLYVLPNLFTMGCLFCGFYSIAQSFHSDGGMDGLYRAALAIVYAAFFDAFDGRVARATRTNSAFGLELDSLADVVAFGVAPAALVYNWGLAHLGIIGLFVSFIWVACGALRLARFNILSHGHHKAEGKPSKYFVGLPIPMAAAVIVCLVVLARKVAGAEYEPAHWALAAVVIGVALLMVSRFKFRSFKTVNFRSKNTLLIVGAILAAVVAIWVGFRGSYVFAFLMAVYLGLGLVETLFRRNPV